MVSCIVPYFVFMEKKENCSHGYFFDCVGV